MTSLKPFSVIHFQQTCLLILVCLTGCSSLPNACDTNITVSNTSKATLFYPCDITEPTPATTLTSGYGASHSVLKWMAKKIAEDGFVVLAMTPVDKYGKNSGWRDAHLAGIAEFKTLNRTEGPLKNKIALNRLQVCGHSKGGGGALMASAQLGPKLKSTIAMAPWQEQFDSLDDIASATLFQTGRKDRHVTHKMTMKEYEMLPENIDKAYFEYPSAHHFSWGVLNMRLLHDTLGSDILAWMNFYLKEDKDQYKKLSITDDKSIHLWKHSYQEAAR